MKGLRLGLAGALAAWLVRALFATTRVRTVGEEAYRAFRDRGERVILVAWHSQLLPLIHRHRDQAFIALVSEHGDGEYLARALERLGWGTVRGSSTRGGMKGLKGLIRAAREGRGLALTPDGPRGPAREIKPGALAVAQITGLPIQPLAAGASRGWRLSSWDAFLVPRPFSRVCVAYGTPRRVPRELDREALERIAGDLEAELNALTAVAERSA
jgi:lysophospholipid acyltransferase (LPLAT)-like uncharacterized protein